MGERDTCLPMSQRPRVGVVCLLVALPVVMIGCGGEARPPTAVTPLNDLEATTSTLDAREARSLETLRACERRHLTPREVIAEAKLGLGAVLTGEQAYYQKWVTFTEVSDPADFRARLGVYLGDLLRRWDFSVSGASATGFLASARGRDDTNAEGITVTLSHQIGQPDVWTVQHRRHWR